MKRISAITIVLIVLLVTIVLICFFYGKITFLDGVTKIGAGVFSITLISYFLKWIFSREMKEIDDKRYNLYEPISDKIKFFTNTYLIAPDSNLKNLTNELYILENALIEIEKKSNYELDFQTKQFITKVLGNPLNHSKINLDRLSELIETKTKKLKDDRQKWDKW